MEDETKKDFDDLYGYGLKAAEVLEEEWQEKEDCLKAWENMGQMASKLMKGEQE